MNMQQLESFIQVAETLNFARAAELLNITQSAVSRQIHALEEELNTKLFFRTTRTVTLTPEGTIFLEHAKRILGQLKMATAKIRHHSNAHTQILPIGCEGETDLAFLGDILRTCREEIPAFHPFLKIIPHRSLWNLFYQGELEVLFGFQESLPAKNQMRFTELRKVPLCCVLPAGHPLARNRQIGGEELLTQHLVLCDSYNLPARVVEVQHRLAQRIVPENLHICESPQVILTLVRAGYGCSILPAPSAPDPSLVFLPLKDIEPLPYGMIYSKNTTNPLLQQFLEVAMRVGRR